MTAKQITPRRAKMPQYARDRQVIEAIIRHTDYRGYAPTMRELAAEVGVSLTRIAQIVKRLFDKGIVHYRPRTARTIAVDRKAAAQFLDS